MQRQSFSSETDVFDTGGMSPVLEQYLAIRKAHVELTDFLGNEKLEIGKMSGGIEFFFEIWLDQSHVFGPVPESNGTEAVSALFS